MRQEERTQIYLDETFCIPEDGDTWAFYDGVWHYGNGRWFFPKNNER